MNPRLKLPLTYVGKPLHVPASRYCRGGRPISENLYRAKSAASVTCGIGLPTLEAVSLWSPAGQRFVLLLSQIETNPVRLASEIDLERSVLA